MIQKILSVASLLMLVDYGLCSNATYPDNPKNLHLTEEEKKTVMEFKGVRKKNDKVNGFKGKMDRLAFERSRRVGPEESDDAVQNKRNN